MLTIGAWSGDSDIEPSYWASPLATYLADPV
jgi:hypothetical protein